MNENRELQLAVLIDADNIPYSHVKEMLEEITKFGLPTIKRIYGDWTKNTVAGWKPALLEHAITPVQQYAYTRGKNATDSAMIIDAMDILHSNKVDGFCIVSSDSDFTRLATRLRESRMLVIGIGEKKTPRPFIVACDKFIYIEILKEADSPKEAKVPQPSSKTQVEKMDKATIRLLISTIEDLADDEGWAFLAAVGAQLNKRKPDFDPRNYGFSKLTPLISSLKKYFVVDVKQVANSPVKHVYVKVK